MINSTVFLKKRKNTVRSGGLVQNVATNVDAEQAQKDVSYEDIIVPYGYAEILLEPVWLCQFFF